MSLARVNSRRNCGEELGAVGRERRRNGKEEEEKGARNRCLLLSRGGRTIRFISIS